MRKYLVWGMWLLLILAIVAAAIFAWRKWGNRNPPEPGTSVTLVCSKECAARAQCGTTMESPEIPVILAGTNYPVVGPDQHDIFFPNGAKAEIRDTMSVTLEDVDGNRFDEPFSRIEYLNPLNDTVSGWVPEWCIERP